MKNMSAMNRREMMNVGAGFSTPEFGCGTAYLRWWFGPKEEGELGGLICGTNYQTNSARSE
ncbi:MAG: hypothetical protein QF645_06520 [Planctomycetota bacterium]|nr:hypothetical protein [Planctomycetota bacterium]